MIAPMHRRSFLVRAAATIGAAAVASKRLLAEPPVAHAAAEHRWLIDAAVIVARLAADTAAPNGIHVEIGETSTRDNVRLLVTDLLDDDVPAQGGWVRVPASSIASRARYLEAFEAGADRLIFNLVEEILDDRHVSHMRRALPSVT